MKKIEETFSYRLNGSCLAIIASNHKGHQMRFSHGSPIVIDNAVYKNTDELRKVAKFIVDIADKIDKDKDFKK